MSILTLKLLSCILIFLTGLLGGSLAIRSLRKQHPLLPWLISTTHGIFLGTALFHLLPEAAGDIANQSLPHNLYIGLACLIGLLTIALIERACLSQRVQLMHSLMAYLITLSIAIHAFFTGLALGLSATWIHLSILLFAIMAHKGFASFALTLRISQQQITQRTRMSLLLLFSLATPIGILLASGLMHGFDLTFSAYFNAFSAGTFIYIGLNHGKKIEAEWAQVSRQQHIIGLLLGCALMGGLSVWV